MLYDLQMLVLQKTNNPLIIVLLLKNTGILVDRLNKKRFHLCMLSKYSGPGKQEHFDLTNGNLVYCFYGESFFFQTQLT